ncbi:MAG: hypothetical protein HY360_07405 [Verrucomicrobia bacterium]|nr:hypothetical protein [Verrucomicrobiota bacterium]
MNTKDSTTKETSTASRHDREILRLLAGRLREIADSPENAARKQLWHKHNALQSERPMILAFPEGGWGETLTLADCKCEDEELRRWEHSMRMKLHTIEVIRDDQTVEPWFDVNWRVQTGNHGVEIPYLHGDNRGSYVWTPPIKDLERDFDKLQFRQFSVDRDATMRDMNRAKEIFGDLLPPRIHGAFFWTCGLTQTACFLIGIEQFMYATYDQPQALHRLMAFLRDDHARFLDWLEAENLLSSGDDNDYTGSGGVAYTRELMRNHKEGEPIHHSNRWGFAESQETVGISSDMFAEFVLPYQLPLLERFGLNCYGCCEQLEHRIRHIVKQVPRLRRVSVAPKANQEAMAAALGRNAIFSRKSDPTTICTRFHEKEIREELRQTLDVAGDLNLELIMKDTHTFQNEPHRITQWVQIAREEVDRHVAGRKKARSR